MRRLLSCVAVLWLLSGCDVAGVEVRYRIDVTVWDHGVLRRGHAIWAERLSRPLIPLASSYSGRMEGEAIPIPTEGGRLILVVPLPDPGGGGSPEMIPEIAFRVQQTPGVDRMATMRRVRGMTGHSRTIGCALGAMDDLRWKPAEPIACLFLAETTDPGDPLAIVPVPRKSAAGDALFIKSVTITISDAPVSHALARYLPWIENSKRIAEINRKLVIPQSIRNIVTHIRRGE